ncbi:MAG: hypothetical protein WDW36_000536 [Sanguina aurantia]
MPVGGASSWASVFTLCNSAIGAGVLSLPFAFQSAGVLGGLLLCLIIGGMEGFTLYVLSKAAQRYEASSYNKLVRKCLGKKLGLVLASIQVVYLAGSCVAYQVIIGDTFSSLGVQALGRASPWLDRQFIILLLSSLVILPVCFFRKITALSSLSSIAVAGFVYTALAVVYSGLQLAAARPPGRHWEGMQLVKWDLQALYAIPIVVFGFNCHANVVTIFSELMPRPDRLLHILPASPSDYASLPFYTPRPSSLKMIGMLGVIASALGIIMSGYLLVGSAGYIAYPLNANSNILNSFPADDHVIQVARVAIGCVVLAHYPLNHHPARGAFEYIHAYFSGTGSSSGGSSSSGDDSAEGSAPAMLCHLFTIIFVASTTAVSLLVNDLGDVLHLIGGTAASFMIFCLPGLLLMSSSVQKSSSEKLAADGLRVSSGSRLDASETDLMNARTPLLSAAAEHGLKATGLLFYSPRRSWATGLALLLFGSLMLVITTVTVFVR